MTVKERLSVSMIGCKVQVYLHCQVTIFKRGPRIFDRSLTVVKKDVGFTENNHGKMMSILYEVEATIKSIDAVEDNIYDGSTSTWRVEKTIAFYAVFTHKRRVFVSRIYGDINSILNLKTV